MQSKQSSRARLIDVAARAGVAPNTASTIINKRGNSWASEETRARVLKAAEELGYTPSKAALGIRTGKFHSVGLVIPDLHNPFYTAFADYLQLALRSSNYDLIIEHSRNILTQEQRCFEAILGRQVDGAAFFLSDIEVHRPFLAKLAQQHFPAVALAAIPESPLPIDAVLSDFSPGVAEAIDHLIALGHQRFTFLRALADGQDDGHRTELFLQLLSSRGISGDSVSFVRCGHEIENARQAFTELLQNHSIKRPTAVIAMNDLSAFGAMRAAIDAGLVIPRDISIIGTDNIPWGAHLPVALSTMAQPIEDMANRTASILLGRLDRGRVSTRPTQTIFQTELLLRESTARAPV